MKHSELVRLIRRLAKEQAYEVIEEYHETTKKR